MSDMAERLNAALEGRYAIERELGEGCGSMARACSGTDVEDHRHSLGLQKGHVRTRHCRIDV